MIAHHLKQNGPRHCEVKCNNKYAVQRNTRGNYHHHITHCLPRGYAVQFYELYKSANRELCLRRISRAIPEIQITSPAAREVMRNHINRPVCTFVFQYLQEIWLSRWEDMLWYPAATVKDTVTQWSRAAVSISVIATSKCFEAGQRLLVKLIKGIVSLGRSSFWLINYRNQVWILISVSSRR